MAENEDGASKTEEATPRKLAKAKEKGDVAKTADLPAVLSLAAAASVVAIFGGWLSRDLLMKLMPFIAHPEEFTVEGGGGVVIARQVMMAAAPILGAVLVAASLAGAAGNLIQHGLIFAPTRLAPKLDKISPMAGFKRVFGIDGFVQFLKNFLKICIVAALAWFMVKPHVREFVELPALDPAAILPFSAKILRDLVFAVIGLMVALAGFDWFWQRYRFLERMKMTKEETKEEYRQTEGDPHVKARLRQLRVEKSRRRMMQAVPDATVVVMNPTHYAVALKYEQGETPAPVCVAKGLDTLALKIRALAEENGVPVIEDPPLARALYSAVEVDQAIPPKHYEAVAKIIGFIMGAGKRRSVWGG